MVNALILIVVGLIGLVPYIIGAFLGYLVITEAPRWYAHYQAYAKRTFHEESARITLTECEDETPRTPRSPTNGQNGTSRDS